MVQKTKKIFNDIPSWLKMCTAFLLLLGMLSGGLYALHYGFVSDKEIVQVRQEISELELRILQTRLENITDTYYRQKQLAEQHPNDNEIKQELENLKTLRMKIKTKIKQKLEFK